MPFAPRIYKDILVALNDHIIPALWQQRTPICYVTSSLTLPESVRLQLLTTDVPLLGDVHASPFITTFWPEAKLHSTAHSYLSFVYEGNAKERTLIMPDHATRHHAQQGIYALSATAPCALYFPAGTPRDTGACSFLDEQKEHSHDVKILQIALLDRVFVHTHIEIAGRRRVSHSLQVEDPSLSALADLLEREGNTIKDFRQDIACAILLAFMLRLRHQLMASPIRLANTAYPRQAAKGTPLSDNEIFQKAIYFIHVRLHEKLSAPQIARAVNTSPTQLNRYFRKFAGISTMDYVQKQRIDAAKQMLINQPENIEEIALLLGYRYSTTFSAIFRKEVGMSPLKYRQKFSVNKD